MASMVCLSFKINVKLAFSGAQKPELIAELLLENFTANEGSEIGAPV